MTSNSNTNRQMPRPVRGNSFNISIKVVARRLDGTVIDKFELDEKADVIVTNRGTVTHAPFKVTADNVAIVHFDGTLPDGIYGIDFTGHYDGEPWRFAVPAVFQVVELTTQGWLPADGIIHEPTYDVDAGVVFNVTDEPQADWAETDPRRSSYIQHKPEVYTKTETDAKISEEKQERMKSDAQITEQMVRSLAGKCNTFHGDFNAGNITEAGWYDSIVSGRPEGSESDEKYLLYQSENGGQVCWSRRNSGKTFHRLGKEHPWVATTHDDYGLQHATAMSLQTYVFKEAIEYNDWNAILSDGFGVNAQAGLAEYYAGDGLEVEHAHVTKAVHLKPNDVLKVRCLYRRGLSREGIEKYPFDSDAYIYVSTQTEPAHDLSVLRSDFIKVMSLGSQQYNFTEEQKNYQSLAFIRQELFTADAEYGWHYLKTNVQTEGNYILHIVADFSTAGSWLVIGEAEVRTKGMEQEQADWSETDPSRLSFIKNKPEVYTKSEVDAKDKTLNNYIVAVDNSVGTIYSYIPAQASVENKLADKNFVNSSIATNTAEYISNNGLPFSSVAELQAYTGHHDNNDYAFVKTLDALGNEVYYRYKYSDATGQWAMEYKLNNSSFTAAQWEAINSMITSGLVAKLQALPTAAELAQEFNNMQSNLTFDEHPTVGSTNPVTSDGIAAALMTSYMKWGVTSQQQNWTKSADGGYDYTMSNITHGYIPQANIDLFEEAGAVFNEESGYFELNGLTDISYNEMMAIYREASYLSLYTAGDSHISALPNSPRTYIYNIRNNLSVITTAYIKLFTYMEIFGKEGFSLQTSDTTINTSFYNNMFYLKKINIVIKLKLNTKFSSTCFQCPSLELVKIQLLNNNIDFHMCARLNYESIRYLIDNATDSVKTVTVHPTTYDYLTGTAEPTERVGGTSEEWQQMLTDATEKNISFATND